MKYNEEHGIVPKQIVKKRQMSDLIQANQEIKEKKVDKAAIGKIQASAAQPKAYTGAEEMGIKAADPLYAHMNKEQLEKAIAQNRKSMEAAAKQLNFIEAAGYRDEIIRLEDLLKSKA